MPDYRGKCAGCGVGKKHANFKGRRDGRLIPDPCHVKLRWPRPAKDDRLCTKCYKEHLANTPAPPTAPTSDQKTRRRSSTSSLDGVEWSEIASERVAKVRRQSSDGVDMIPMHVHEKKMEELKQAMRRESATLLELSQWEMDELAAVDRLELEFRSSQAPLDVKEAVFHRAKELYRQKPCSERAQLFQDLSNEFAAAEVGISSHTLAKARSGNVVPKKNLKRNKKMRSGLSRKEVEEIARNACFDQRFCEIRSWKTFSGGRVDSRWECIGLVDVETMWKSLCERHGEFCSLRTFYRAMPDFFVPKKKDRCVCVHCKAGRRCLDDTSVIINALKGSAQSQVAGAAQLKKLRVDLMHLFGHLDKELVVGVADGRHEASLEGCKECELVKSIPVTLRQIVKDWDGPVQISADEWSTVFPGTERPLSGPSRLSRFDDFLSDWPAKVNKYCDHLLLKADRICAVEGDVEALRTSSDAEVWFADYAMPVKLIGTWNETEQDFLSKDTANILGFMRVYKQDGTLWREYWDFVFEGSKDIQSSMQIQLCLLGKIQEERSNAGLGQLKKLKIWADNAGDFKGGDMWGQWMKELKNQGNEVGLSCVELNYHAAGEGKTSLDAHFGHLTTIRAQRERRNVERRNVADLLDAMAEAEATHVVHVEVNREDESRFYRPVKGSNAFHRVVVTKSGLEAQNDSKSALEKISLGKVTERNTKNARRMRAEKHASVVHEASLEECQVCLLKMGKNEQLSDWIRCDTCERSWHKTCVGYDATASLDIVDFSQCKECGGADPAGKSLKKRRKAPVCRVCGQRIKGIDHSQCKLDMEVDEANFRTPAAVERATRAHLDVPKKNFAPTKEKRTKRKLKRRRSRSGTVVTMKEREQLEELL